MVWVIIFLLIAIVSFVLALKSMVNFRQNPKDLSSDLGIFLIGKPENLTDELLDSLYQIGLKKRLILSLERLFKGKKSALVVFGERSIMNQFSQTLSLLELEDYSLAANEENVLIWDYSVKSGTKPNYDINLKSVERLDLKDNEQFFWQITLQPLGNKLDQILFKMYKKLLGYNASNPTQDNDKLFISNIRGVLLSDSIKKDEDRFNKIAQQFNLVITPSPFKSSQRLDFFQTRQVLYSAKLAILINSQHILKLINLK